MPAQPVNVVLTGGAGQIAYSLAYTIAKGDVFGKDTPVNLRLLDIQPMMGVLEGVVMELQDCALPLLRDVKATANEQEAFTDADSAFLVGAMPRREGMERKDLLQANVKIFKSQGSAIDKFARKSIKVLVVGNPANTNALICSKFAPSIPKESFTAMTRLDQNRAQAQLAIKLNVPCDSVSNVIIWGNHSGTQFPDASQAVVVQNGKEQKVEQAVNDDAYLKNQFVSIVQQRGAAVIAARKLSSAMSAANAAADHMRNWWSGTAPGKFVSMGVISDGNTYNAPSGLIYSFPVTCANGKWTIVNGLPVSDFARSKLDTTAAELVSEREEAFAATA